MKQNPLRPAHPAIERARTVSRLLDSAVTIPVINKKIGLDPILGLFPVGGDVVSALLAAYLVWVALTLRLPRSVAVRMSANILVDLLIGALPVVGDVLDAFWQSNRWNFELLEAAYQKHGVSPRPERDSRPTVDVLAEPVTG